VRERDLRNRRQAKAAEHDRHEPGQEEQINEPAGPTHPLRAAPARILENRKFKAIGRAFSHIHGKTPIK
jgi:hypothetical protein